MLTALIGVGKTEKNDMFCLNWRSKRVKEKVKECRKSLTIEAEPGTELDVEHEEMEDDSYEAVPEYRIAVLGAPDVGKSALCERIAKDQQTAVDHFDIAENIDGELARLSVDTAKVTFPTRQKLTNLRRAVLTAEGYILVYSVTDRGSLGTIHQLMSYIQHVRKNRDIPIVLVGNKMDCGPERCISQEQGRQVAFDLGVSFYETSSRLTLAHVTKVFHDLVRQIRCVTIRQEFERDRQKEDKAVYSALCGSRGVMTRISLRSKTKRKKYLLRDEYH